MPNHEPRVFMIYTHFDDQRDGRRIANLRERLSGEIQMQTGKPFEIFQEVKDVELGQSAESRIETSPDEPAFLIPILTPSFFNSDTCRDEVLRFLEYEEELGRNDLILPVYYVNHLPLNSPEAREGDEAAVALAAHQWIDWRDLRQESSTSAAFGGMLERVALRIRDALDRVGASDGSAVSEPGATPVTGPSSRGPSSQPQAATQRESEPEARHIRGEASGDPERTEPSGPAEKTEPTTLVVDQSDEGGFKTIGEAIKAASPGDRIMVRPGEYHEGLIIDKPLEIVGDGEVDEIVVEAENADAILFQASMGRVANLTLRQTDEWSCVDIAQGRLILEDCDITSHSNDGVAVHGGADPLILRNRIHGCGEAGIYVYDSGKGSIEDNDIFGNALANVLLRGSNTTLRRNRIHDGADAGVIVYRNGEGIVEDNDIFGNAGAGVTIATGGNPTVQGNRIHDGGEFGVFVYRNGKGTIDDNDIFGNAGAGVTIATGGNPTVQGNRIHDGGEFGVFVYKNGKGTIEDNDIFGHPRAGVEVREGGNPTVRRNRIHDGARSGVSVSANGKGTFEDNDIFGNANAGVEVSEGGNPTLRRNRINKNSYEAVWVYDGGGGTFEHNDQRDNVIGEWNISTDSQPNVTRIGNCQE